MRRSTCARLRIHTLRPEIVVIAAVGAAIFGLAASDRWVLAVMTLVRNRPILGVTDAISPCSHGRDADRLGRFG